MHTTTQPLMTAAGTPADATDLAFEVIYLMADDALASLGPRTDATESTARMLDMIMNLVESARTVTADGSPDVKDEWEKALYTMIDALR